MADKTPTLDWFAWTRDSALTLKVLVERFIAGDGGDKSLQIIIDNYVNSSSTLQGVSNPSGGPQSGGLGEPKFHVNLTAFTGSWGRPQRDGPALRATALSLYANWLADNGQTSKIEKSIWPVIEKDLDYTVKYWNRTGFDLWEEINGSSFFTLAASHRALVEGAALADKLGKSCPGCKENAPRALCFLQSFWINSPNGGYVDSNINVNDGRTGKDANSLISSIHTFDPESPCSDSTFQPCSSKALANHKAVVDSFRSIYTVNKDRRGIGSGRAAAVGRYSEDVYYNGNPWYLTTSAAAEQLYAAVYQWKKIGSITVDKVSLPFFRDLIPNIAEGTYKKGSSDQFDTIVKAVYVYAEGFLSVVQKYTPTDGSLREQFDRNNGSPLSAIDLTWSYAAFVSASERRSGIVPPSWGASGASEVPAVCEPAPSCNSEMTFNVKATTVFGENIFVVGSITELKNWTPADAIPLDASNYPIWSAKIQIPAETIFEYKYIRKTADGKITWESDPNNRATSSTGCGSKGTLNDEWR